jgi:TPP-dependent pyruvate/acetoin dehydrogenase alpha subunit
MRSDLLFGQAGAIARMVHAMGVTSRTVDGRDVLGVREVTEELLEIVRAGRPAFMECIVFRVQPHSIADPDYRYRERNVGEAWLQTNDPIMRLRELLEPVASAELDAIDDEVDHLVETALDRAAESEQTPASDARSLIYATEPLQRRA